MKKKIRLTDSDLVRLVKKIVNEQRREDDPNEDYFKIIDIVANHAMDEEDDLDEVERCINEIYKIMHEAYQDEELSDEQADEIIDYAKDVVKELETMFDLNESKKKDEPVSFIVSSKKDTKDSNVNEGMFGKKEMSKLDMLKRDIDRAFEQRIATPRTTGVQGVWKHDEREKSFEEILNDIENVISLYRNL